MKDYNRSHKSSQGLVSDCLSIEFHAVQRIQASIGEDSQEKAKSRSRRNRSDNM